MSSRIYMNSLYGGARQPSPTPSMDDDDEERITLNEDASEMEMDRVTPEFANKLTATKRLIYSAIIFANDESTPEAQDTRLLNDYLRMIKTLYDLFQRMKATSVSEQERAQYVNSLPESARQSANDIVVIYDAFLTQNKEHEKRIPYESYIQSSLIHHPYVQQPALNKTAA